MKNILLVVILVLSYLAIYAQGHTELSPATLKLYEGRTFEAEQDWEAAKTSYFESIDLRDTVDIRLGHVYLGLGNCEYYQGDLEKSVEYYLKSLEVRESVDPPDYSFISQSHSYLAFNYSYMGKFKESGKHYLANLRIDSMRYEESKDSAVIVNFAGSNAGVGTFYGNIGDYDKQLAYYQKGLTYALESGYQDTLGVFYNNVATGYYYLAEYDAAIDYLQQAMAIDLKRFPDSMSLKIANRLNNLAAIYESKKDYYKRIEILKKAAKIVNALANDHAGYDLLGTIYNNIAKTYIELVQEDSSNKYLDLTEKLGRQLKSDNLLANMLNLRAGLAYNLKDYPTTIKWASLAVDKSKLVYGDHHPQLAQQYNVIGGSHQILGNYSLALEFHEKAIKANKNSRITTEREIQGEFQPIRTLNALIGIAKTHFRLFTETEEEDHLIKALEVFNRVRAKNLLFRKSYSLESSRQYFQSQMNSAYEFSIRTAIELYELKPDDLYLDEVFKFMQTQKALNLYEHLQDRKAKYFAGIPEELLQQELEYKRGIAYLKTLLEGSSLGNDQIQRLNKEMLDLSTAYEALVDKLQKDYPKYFELKYKRENIGIDDIRRLLLNKGDGLIEYFIGDSTVFVLSIFKEEAKIRSFELEGLYDEIEEWKSAMNNAGGPKVYDPIASLLYEKLLGPELEGRETGALVLIPDGVLHQLAFEALVRKRTDEPIYFGDLYYLINDMKISYASSTSLLKAGLEALSINESEGAFIIAPIFDDKWKRGYSVNDNSDTNQFFKVASQEKSFVFLDRLMEFIKGKSYFRNDAKESTFKEFASQYNVLQLSTHAILNDSLPMRSYFLLSKPLAKDLSGEDGIVYTYELFNTSLQADMAVLTACESGRGQYQAGEGVMSLSNAFQYAGCSGTVMSLWPIDERSSNATLEKFYSGLLKKQDRRQALQQAKLDFIKENRKNDLGNPLFWAGMVIQGNYRPVQLDEPKSNWNLIWLAITLAILGLAWISRIRSKQN